LIALLPDGTAALFEGNPIFRAHMLRLDALVRESIGTSVVEALYSPTNSIATTFDRTWVTRPAIFMVEYSMAQALMHAGSPPISCSAPASAHSSPPR
jgi:acyl transferase domain-containing protein